jgi:osmotically-inducible protein OsmY
LVPPYVPDITARSVVILTGEVENRQMKRMAEDIAFSVWGVKDVNDQIRIRPVEDE